MCDHYSADCLCDWPCRVSGKAKRKKKVPDAAATDIDGEPQVHRHDDETNSAMEQLPETALSRPPEELALEEGDGATSLDSDLTLETQAGLKNPLALTALDESPGSLFEDAKETVDEILKEDLHREAVAVEAELEQQAIDEAHECSKCHKCSASEDSATLLEEKMRLAIREAVFEAMRAMEDIKKEGTRHEPEMPKEMQMPRQAEELEEEEDIRLEKNINVEPAFEETPVDSDADRLLTDTSTETQLHPEMAELGCAACAEYAEQKLQSMMAHDPTLSLAKAKMLLKELFSQTAEEKEEILSDPRKNQTVEAFQSGQVFEQLRFLATALGKEADEALRPLTEPAFQVIDDIVDCLHEDGAKVVSALEPVVERAIDGGGDRVGEAVDFAAGFSKWLAEGSVQLVDGLFATADALGQAIDTITHEGRGIVADLLNGGTVQTASPAVHDSLQALDSPPPADPPVVANLQLEVPAPQPVESVEPKQTPLRWLAANVFGRPKQSADTCISQWPAFSGLTVWPSSGQPRRLAELQ